MSELNSANDSIVWRDIPVADLDRAIAFYRAVLAIGVDRMEFDRMSFAILEHDQGNGSCLIPHARYTCYVDGLLVYMNVDWRIRDAVDKVGKLGNKLREAIHPIGLHGIRAITLDSERNRIALHSTVDA